MQPRKVPEQCHDRQILHERMRADLRVYREAIVALELNPAPEDYPMVQKNAERARAAYEAARANLEAHIAVHGCEY